MNRHLPTGEVKDFPQMLIPWAFLPRRPEGVISAKPSAVPSGKDPPGTASALHRDGNDYSVAPHPTRWARAAWRIQPSLATFLPNSFPTPLGNPSPRRRRHGRREETRLTRLDSSFPLLSALHVFYYPCPRSKVETLLPRLDIMA